MVFLFIEELLNSVGLQKEIKQEKKHYSSKYATKPIELNNKNIVYPDNKLEKEIESLYKEIRELQSQNNFEIAKHKLCR